MDTIPNATRELLTNVLVGSLTSALVAWISYRLGRSDMMIERWASQIDSVLEKLAFLDPRRFESVRPGDGVDDTSHAIRCMGAVMKISRFEQGQKIVESIAQEMVNWCKTTDSKGYEDAMRIKERWNGLLENEVAGLRKLSWWNKWRLTNPHRDRARKDTHGV
jgi:hypothetical protein